MLKLIQAAGTLGILAVLASCGASEPVPSSLPYNTNNNGNGGGGGQPTDYASLLVGSWLGPEPGFSQGQCSNGTTEYTFNSDHSWAGHNVNQDACGGTFTFGGTYSITGNTLLFHYTMCPEGCSRFPDTSESMRFIDNTDFSLSDPSFSGTYHRQ